MSLWLKKEIDAFVKTLVRLTGHSVTILIALIIEGLIFYLLQSPTFESARFDLEPVLKAALLSTISLLCVIFVSLLALSGWTEVKKRHDEDNGGTGGWVILGVVLSLTVIAIVFFKNYPTVVQPQVHPGLPAYDVAFEFPRSIRGKLDAASTLDCPPEAERLKFTFFVPVQRNYHYFAAVDQGQPELLQFHEDGVLDQIIRRSNLKSSPHRLVVYKQPDGEDTFVAVDFYRFTLNDAN